jgi:diguanylate cyclase (GGDEF)-like protein
MPTRKGTKKIPGSATVAEIPASWNAELSESLYRLLYSEATGDRELADRLAELERVHHDAVYSELIYLLSHLRFEGSEAREQWRRIVEHRDAMQKRLGKPVDLRVALVSYFVEVSRRLKNPKVIELKLFEETHASAYRDELTGLYNYRSFREHLGREIQRSERSAAPVSIVMIDIDNFKQFNDQHGHETGNRALATIAKLLRDSLRQVDIAARYGGEEFVLILPATTKTSAAHVAERARVRVERTGFAERAALTVSLGVATYPADARGAEELVRRADSAMYYAKSRGKNQVHLYGENRRSFRRVPASLRGSFHLLAAESHPLTTLNLSEGGFLFATTRSLPVGSLVDVLLDLPQAGDRVEATCRVIRVEEREGGRYEAAVRILEIAGDDQIRLCRFVKTLVPQES